MSVIGKSIGKNCQEHRTNACKSKTIFHSKALQIPHICASLEYLKRISRFEWHELVSLQAVLSVNFNYRILMLFNLLMRLWQMFYMDFTVALIFLMRIKVPLVIVVYLFAVIMQVWLFSHSNWMYIKFNSITMKTFKWKLHTTNQNIHDKDIMSSYRIKHIHTLLTFAYQINYCYYHMRVRGNIQLKWFTWAIIDFWVLILKQINISHSE